jgi:hypothetical protein
MDEYIIFLFPTEDCLFFFHSIINILIISFIITASKSPFFHTHKKFVSSRLTHFHSSKNKP